MTRNCGHRSNTVNIPAATFKAECLKLMDQVEKTRKPIVITKHGRPVAQLAPIPAVPRSLFGYMKNSVAIPGDITAPLDEEWSALSGDEDHLYEHPARKSKRPKK
ncbi:MAG: type II toxin-antitoxin system prevent-host-death family antitoxin [Bryobacterales bacterium]|nr:type II toxin-antitoxin system prevent-host-death family antitoxin [Bryobacterales bacterium]